MLRKASFVVVVAAGLIAVMTALYATSPRTVSEPVAYAERGHQVRPRYVESNTLDRCFLEPFECGLVVWSRWRSVMTLKSARALSEFPALVVAAFVVRNGFVLTVLFMLALAALLPG